MAETMTVFVWEGVDKKGARVKGETTAANENLAKADLRRQGINPLKVRKKPKPLFGGKKKITPKDIAVFLRQMSTMMSAGVPLVQAFEIVGRGHENPSMQELILRIKSDVEGGSTFASALAKHPLYFDDLVVNLVGAGEQSGALETLLDRIATYKEKTESLKAKIKKAMFYPAAVIVVAFIVTAILLIFVVPQFQDLFQGFGADLPVFTQFVIGISDFFQNYWWAIFGGIGLAVFAFTQGKRRSPGFRRQLDLWSLRVPVVGELLRKASIARFARTLSTMFSAGVPLVEAMQSVAGATGNALYYEATMRMRDETAGGTQLQQAMRNTGVFPNMVVQMVAIGEESGSLDEMLGKVADFYEEEVDNMVDGLSSLMEPMIMAFLGIVVGGLVIAMYLPIFQLGAVV
ncbi:type II secretion system protein F [Ectothiorhodospira haloalkaliphila]|uniref:Type II secretion system protein F n=1 Tax=Ectothiorhodospira haloalkaliphila TaxID=421628 RepID=W8KMP5_9GAMM|nr:MULTISPECIES: type II secretion system F family protein [Ectothiorhodospira]AHK78272.1 type II secretion system protein F [Ectothiorhodospira haloalkaliphila]MCG5493382.1 type II secretion system F family protein [Ectothiorhodospira variabilis]MCG5502711.1 type II secretion system F family protein [Ectothiorhodospira variabilis]MCG5505523.1 type II secretion system F family protein [Ectothiorhodospira variabilis]MCG5523437.1 type II secretion system F family protein [Ectothiorhodospira halo